MLSNAGDALSVHGLCRPSRGGASGARLAQAGGWRARAVSHRPAKLEGQGE